MPVTEADLVGLPTAAQHYLHAMGVIGRPRTWSFWVRYTGLFRLRPGGQWTPVTESRRARLGKAFGPGRGGTCGPALSEPALLA